MQDKTRTPVVKAVDTFCWLRAKTFVSVPPAMVPIQAGGATGTSESSHLQESSVHYNIPELQSTLPCRPLPPPPHSQPHSNAHQFHHPLSHVHPQPNGQHISTLPPHREASGTREELSGPDDSEEDEEEEEDEAPTSKWQGIESIFEAYQEYVEGEQPQGTLGA